MSDWLRNCVVYEINTWVWLNQWSVAAGRRLSLGNLPDEAWDQIATLGVSAVWMMGVWERSPTGLALALRHHSFLSQLRLVLPDLRPRDIVGSPYCIRRYVVDPNLGGTAGLAAARRALAQRGIRLILDFVPNHLAPDHPWVSSHPDWFIRGSRLELRQNPGAFLQVRRRVFARGRDPYFPPWSDVLQLNACNIDQRRATVRDLLRIADHCDGVRCDMAMLMINQVFARTWPGCAGTVPAEDYWREVIPAVRSSRPDFQFIAEVYWDWEVSLLEQGFNGCYDKGLYDCLAHSSAEAVRNHLVRLALVQDRLVRFIENHDEPRAAQVFPWPKSAAAAVVLMMSPGIRLLHEGQLEGRKVKAPVHLSRRPEEAVDPVVHDFYSRLLRIAGELKVHSGEWSLCEICAWPDNSSHRQLLAWCWGHSQRRWLIVVNYSHDRAQGRIRVPWPDLVSKRWRLVDSLTNATQERAGDELARWGLPIDLPAWGCYILRFHDI